MNEPSSTKRLLNRAASAVAGQRKEPREKTTGDYIVLICSQLVAILTLLLVLALITSDKFAESFFNMLTGLMT